MEDEMQKITFLARVDGSDWEDKDVDEITKGLRHLGVRCVVCGNLMNYPQLILLTKPCTWEQADSVTPENIEIRFSVVDIQKSSEAREFFLLLFKHTAKKSGN